MRIFQFLSRWFPSHSKRLAKARIRRPARPMDSYRVLAAEVCEPRLLLIATVTITAPDNVCNEAGNTGTFTVTRSEVTSSALSVNLTVGGNATNGVDYVTIGSPISIPANTASVNITLNAYYDGISDNAETVSLSPAFGSNYIAGSGATIGITDAAGASINDVSHNEGNSGTTNYVFTISLTYNPAQQVTVNYSVVDDTAKRSDNDYGGTASSSVSFSTSQSSQTITIPVYGDVKPEIDEVFHVNISSSTANVTDSQGNATIVNDDKPTLNLTERVTRKEGNMGTTDFVFWASLNGPTNQTVTAHYATSNGTASYNSDYTNTVPNAKIFSFWQRERYGAMASSETAQLARRRSEVCPNRYDPTLLSRPLLALCLQT